MYFLPLPLDRSQHALAAILTFTMICRLSEAIPIPVTAVPALAAVFGASFGFMMPVSTPQNAVV